MLRTLVDAVVAALLAPVCAICGAVLERPLDGAVCSACWSRVVRFTPPVCAACGSALASARAADTHHGRCRRCAVELTNISCARAVGPFDGVMVDIVHALKYARRPSVAGPLAVLMRRAAVDVLDGVDLVVPVPLHPRRERNRGFNQAEALARGLGPPVCHALRRTAVTPPQVALSDGRDATTFAGPSRSGPTLDGSAAAPSPSWTMCSRRAPRSRRVPLPFSGRAAIRIVAVTAARAESAPRD